MRLAAICVLAFAFHTYSAAEPRTMTKSRRLSNLERMELRHDSRANVERRAAALAKGRQLPNADSIVVDGSRDPELLTPWELMDLLSATYYLREHGRKQQRWIARGAKAYMGEDFVTRIRTVAAPWIDADAELRRIGERKLVADAEERAALQQQWAMVNRSICPLRAQALTALREEFGRENFDRFLYEAVAPDVFVVTTRASSPEAAAELDRWVEDGCR